MIQLGSAQYNNIQAPNLKYIKFNTLRYTIAGSADYVVMSGTMTSWRFDVLVSASASALGAGISAGGLDSLRQAYASATAIPFVSDEAVTATALFHKMEIRERLNPTKYICGIELARAV